MTTQAAEAQAEQYQHEKEDVHENKNRSSTGEDKTISEKDDIMRRATSPREKTRPSGRRGGEGTRDAGGHLQYEEASLNGVGESRTQKPTKQGRG